MKRFGLMAVLAISLTVGCNGSSDFKPVSEVKKAPPLPDHDHGEKGPHGGGLIELGNEEYHAELVLDEKSHTIGLFVLGKDAKSPEAISAADVSIKIPDKDAFVLKAAPQPNDPAGKASKFELVAEELIHTLIDAGFLHGKLAIVIGDKSFEGEIDYHMSGAHHDHDEHK